MVDNINNLAKCKPRFFRNNRLFIVPAINVDSYHLISQSYGKKEWQEVKEIRKNQRKGKRDCRKEGKFEGVDLNRNYDIQFDSISTGASSDECSDEYRGPNAFSEPETQAVKRFLDQNPTVVSALNFHAYANLWIYPYSYNTDARRNILAELDKRLWKTYQRFYKLAFFPKGAKFGTAVNTIQYTATGEASDWMLGKKNVFAFSPELGYPNSASQSFYPDVDSQTLAIRYVLMLNHQWPLPNRSKLLQVSHSSGDFDQL